jgi:glucokinase
MSYVIGIDLGCTNIKGLAVSLAGEVLAEVSLPTQEEAGRRVWSRNVWITCERLFKTVGNKPSVLGIAAPGLPARDQYSIAYMPGRLQGLEGLDWRKFLRVEHPVPVLNDAQAALLGETWLGAAKNCRNAILLTLGTGVGGAAMVDGHLLRGHIGRAGHLGHISLNPDAELDVANTPGSLESAIGDCTVQARSGGRFLSTKSLLEAAQAGDRLAAEVWGRSIKSLAAGVAGLINVLDPEIVVIGGGIVRSGESLLRPLRSHLKCFEWRPGGHKARVAVAKLGDRAGAFGAAWNALHHAID